MDQPETIGIARDTDQRDNLRQLLRSWLACMDNPRPADWEAIAANLIDDTHQALGTRIILRCNGCGLPPRQIELLCAAGFLAQMSADEYVWQRESTLNRRNGHFLCPPCFVSAGSPTSPVGWMAP